MAVGKFWREQGSRVLAFVVPLAMMACTKAPGGGTSFGGPTAGSVSVSVSVTAGEEDTGDSSGTGTGDDSTTSGNDVTTGEMSSTTMPVGDSTTGTPTTLPPTTLESSGEVGGSGGQPADGQYSHCLMASECAAPTNVCLQLSDANMMVVDGFCTNDACSNPVADCDPAPGGTATPFCHSVTINNAPGFVCALDCSGGKTCPTGMTCYELNGGAMLCA